MPTWNSRGLRGSTLEEYINLTNDIYREKGLALVQKIPTPITPINIDKEKRHITLAYFEKKSTVDYIGVVQGVPICFDAKECNSDLFSLSNIHRHQFDFMRDFEAQKGIAFIIISYTHKDKYYYLSFEELEFFWNRMLNGGKKSFNLKELKDDFYLKRKESVLVHYLEGIQKSL